jgi:hypothetical protein
MILRDVGLLLVFLALAGCGGGDGEPVWTVTEMDVGNLPAGTAVGTTFSGTYVMGAISVTGCHCRLGLCSIDVRTGWTFPSIQQDGMFTQRYPGAPGTTATGGINADGSYTIGSVREDLYGVAYTLTEGHIDLVDGVPKRGQATLFSTVTGIPGLNVDCDLRANETFHYKEPL